MSALLEVRNVSKRFPGVLALDAIDFDGLEGEVHALLGENGAGKSTLVKIITGAYQRDTGTIRIAEQEVALRTPAEAQAAGIGVVYQEFSLISTLSVAENIFLGERGTIGPFVNWAAMNKAAADLLQKFGVNATPTDKVASLGVATRQMIEILKVIHRPNLRILVLDEPTSSLSESETQVLFDFLRGLKVHGVCIIYISHRLDEIRKICDRVTVFRNGKRVATTPAADMTVETMISQMIGSELKEQYPPKSDAPGSAALRVKALSGPGFSEVTFEAHHGEVLGITGLVGAGKTELLETLFGARRATGGTISIGEVALDPSSPGQTISSGIGLLPESRKEQGLVPSMSCTQNISLASLDRIARPFLNLRAERGVARDNFNKLEIRPGDPRNRVLNLSGGNQQKVVLAKWLMRDCDILFFDEPTRGIDVGAKFQIYSLIVALAKAGKAIIVSSSEIEEISGICNRVLVMHRGRIKAELSGAQVNRTDVLGALSGAAQ